MRRINGLILSVFFLSVNSAVYLLSSSTAEAQGLGSFTQDLPIATPQTGAMTPPDGDSPRTFSWSSFVNELPNSKFVLWGLDWLGDASYTRNSGEMMSPGSVEKVITSTTALRVLGADFRFENSFQGNVDTVTHTLSAPEFSVSGDPTWAHPEYEAIDDRIQKVISSLAAQNIQKVVGPIQITSLRPFLATNERPMEWKPSWLLECYATLASTVILNGNCATFKITSNTTAEWETPGVSTPIEVKLHGTNAQVISASIEPVLDNYGRVSKYVISGANPTVKEYSVPVQNNEDWLRNLFTLALKNAGITYAASGAEAAIALLPKTTSANAHPSQSVFVDLSSLPLAQILPHFLQDSLNVIGDRLFLEINSKLGSAAPSDGELQTISLVTGDSSLTAGLKILDGSGLIAADQVSPRVMRFLLKGLTNQSYFQDFLTALPVAGESGTLADRLQNKLTLGKVFAKTGTLDGVSNLAGYFKKPTGALEPFVIMTHSNLDTATVVDLMDRVVVEFARENAH
jgi:D-alanyl-D-alanine carboxypeptidase/D-alanyl-D-alanine-endopeptidase (penicillin-binding protein 4)